MTLRELSVQYYAAAEALAERIRQLDGELAREGDDSRRLLLLHRLRLLRAMRRDTRAVARHLEHYYREEEPNNGANVL